MRVFLLTLGLVALAGCGGPQVYVTSLGPLRVDDLPQLPATAESGLVAETLRGAPVPFEARDAAREALEAHCLDQEVPGEPSQFGWRYIDGRAAWTAAGCDPIPFGDPVLEEVTRAATVPAVLEELGAAE